MESLAAESTLYHALIPYVLGAFLASALVYAARRMHSDELWLFTWVVGVILVGFVGFPLFAGDHSGVVAESALLIFLGVALVTSWVRQATVLLAVVYLLHGASDIAHLLFDISPTNPAWVHELCVPFDWIIASHIFSRTSAWKASAYADGGTHDVG